MTFPTRAELDAVDYDDIAGLRQIAKRMRPPAPRAGCVVEIGGVHLEFNYEQIDAAGSLLGMLRKLCLLWDPELPDHCHAHYCDLLVEPPDAVAHLDPPTFEEAVHWIAVNPNHGDAGKCVKALAHELIHARQREMRTPQGYVDWVEEQRKLRPELNPGDAGYRQQEHEAEAWEQGPKLADLFPNMVIVRAIG